MSKTIAILATLDTKGAEAAFLRQQIEALGGRALVVDIGVLGAPAEAGEVTREEVALAGGRRLSDLQAGATREVAAPVMVAGAATLLQRMVAVGEVHAVLGLGGLQGTAACSEVMRSLPYGVPKVMVSTVASGDTSAYVDIKDVTMMFSVGDILGVNSFTSALLANAAGAAWGMAHTGGAIAAADGSRKLVGMTNLGVLTEGAMHALRRFAEAGCEAIVFHAVGSGGRAMEQLVKEGLLAGVFDYAMGEIADEVFGALRAGGKERMTVAGRLGVPQVIVPGGCEHLGFLVEEQAVPERWKDHTYVWHSPVVFVPRLRADEFARVAEEAARRLQHTKGDAVMMLPLAGTSRYGKAGGPLHDPESDAAFFAALKAALPDTIEVVERDTDAEDPAFVDECVQRMVALLAARA